MAITVTNRDPEKRVDVKGSRRHAQYQITFDASYPTGGYAVTATTFGLNKLHGVVVSSATSAGKPVFFDHTNSKIKVFSAIGTEVLNAASLASETVDLIVSGV